MRKRNDNWKEGTIGVSDGKEKKVIKYMAKVYDVGSDYGINGGRISKLQLKMDGETICNYDRGWDIKPTCPEAETALYILLYEADGTQPREYDYREDQA